MCRSRLWNVACDSSRSDWGVFPRRKQASFTVCGSSCRLWTNSFVAVSATGRLLHAVARALLDFAVGIDDQFAIGGAADLEPRQGPRCRTADHISAMVEARAVAGTREPVLGSRHRTAQMGAGGRDSVETFVVAEQHK